MTQRSPATETRTRSSRTLTRTARDDRRRSRRPDLERQSLSFTVGLYLFISIALLLVHVTAGGVG